MLQLDIMVKEKPEPTEINVCSICENDPCPFEDTGRCPAVEGCEKLFESVYTSWADTV